MDGDTYGAVDGESSSDQGMASMAQTAINLCSRTILNAYLSRSYAANEGQHCHSQLGPRKLLQMPVLLND